MKQFLSSLCLLGLAASLSQAQIAQWTFQNFTASTGQNAGPYAPEVGSGAASGFHAGSAAYSSPAGNGSSRSYSVNTWAVGDYWQFQVSTLGYSGISLSWDQTSSGTGPSLFDFRYSTDGGANFTTFAHDYIVRTNNPAVNNSGSGIDTSAFWSASAPATGYNLSYDLSSVTALENQGSVLFRLVLDSGINAQGTAVAASGTDRVDNFTVTGIAVPEPGSAFLLGSFGLMAWSLIRRRR